MENPLIQKLSRFVALSASEKGALSDLTETVVSVRAHTNLVNEGEKPTTVRVLMDGFACRYKNLPDGGRQIVAFILPGDICNPHVLILKKMDHSIATMAACNIAELSADDILKLTDGHPAIARALWWSNLVDEGISREWITNIGRRRSLRRAAHLLCEMLVRLRIVGLVNEGHFEMPLTQIELADTVSISQVHMNRVLNELRNLGLITLHGKKVTILNVGALEELAGFNPDYLHLSGALLNSLR